MKCKFFLAAATLFALGSFMSGCSDSNEPDAPEFLDKETNFFINVTLSNPAATESRAVDTSNDNPDNYVNGTDSENKINEILFVFYNSAMQYVGSTPIKDKDSSTETNPGTIEKIVSIVVPVTVPVGENKPAFVMAYINPTTNSSDQNKAFNATLGLTRTLEQMTPPGCQRCLKHRKTRWVHHDQLRLLFHGGGTATDCGSYRAGRTFFN